MNEQELRARRIKEAEDTGRTAGTLELLSRCYYLCPGTDEKCRTYNGFREFYRGEICFVKAQVIRDIGRVLEGLAAEHELVEDFVKKDIKEFECTKCRGYEKNE